MKTPLDIQNLIDSTLGPLSEVTLRIMETPKGQFQKVTYASKAQPAAAFKHLELVKTTTSTVSAGKSYENLKAIREAIARGERGEVGELPTGREWEIFPFTLKSNGKRLVRLYPSHVNKPETIFTVDGKQVSRAEFATYLQPAKARELMEGREKPLDSFDISESGLIG